MYISLLMLISVALAVFSIISVVKNFLINFNASDNGWITALLVRYSAMLYIYLMFY